jgi:hypothetical protein
MTDHAAQPQPDYANRLGFYAALSTVALTVVTFGIALFTPPISGANCPEDCIDYPYLEAVDRFPRDYWWMYPAMLLTAMFLVLVVSIHQFATDNRKIFSQIGLSFALMATGVLIVNYFVQVSVIKPSLDAGETEGIALLTQYNPHGLFIALEEIGYLLMSLALLCMAPVFTGADRVERALRWMFGLGFPLMIAALAYVSLRFGVDRQDRFEVIVIAIDWLVLIVGGGLLSVVFRRAGIHLERESSG